MKEFKGNLIVVLDEASIGCATFADFTEIVWLGTDRLNLGPL